MQTEPYVKDIKKKKKRTVLDIDSTKGDTQDFNYIICHIRASLWNMERVSFLQKEMGVCP